MSRKLRLDDLQIESFHTTSQPVADPGTVYAQAAEAALLTQGTTCQGATCQGRTCDYQTCAGPSCQNTFCYASCGNTCAFSCPNDPTCGITCGASCDLATCPSGGGWVCCAETVTVVDNS